MKYDFIKARIGRRGFLFGSAAAVGTLASAPMALAASSATTDAFMTASRLLVNHELSEAVGTRMAAFAAAKYPDLDTLTAQIAEAAAARNATEVEDFFDDLPEGPLRDFAYWVIETWYTGSSSPDRDATLFTYEQALLYRPTLDMVPIPTFGFSAPNAWGQDLFPLSNMPQF